VSSWTRNSKFQIEAVEDRSRKFCEPFPLKTGPTTVQTISFIEISIEAGILLGGKHAACFVLGVAGIEPMPS
jgi:hypothetical protein